MGRQIFSNIRISKEELKTLNLNSVKLGITRSEYFRLKLFGSVKGLEDEKR